MTRKNSRIDTIVYSYAPTMFAKVVFLSMIATLVFQPIQGSYVTVNTLNSQPRTSNDKKFVIRVQLGLSNRLRAMFSAYDQAIKADRQFVVIWEKDVHMNCAFQDLFDTSLFPQVVFVDYFDEQQYPETDYEIYDYMGKDKNKKIDFSTSKNIFVSSAYRLNSQYWKVDDENSLMQSLVPSCSSLNLIARAKNQLGRGKYAGLHIRSLDPLEELPDLPKSFYKKDSLDTLKRTRSASNSNAFGKVLHRLQDDGVDKVFVAADTLQAAVALNKTSAIPVVWVDNGGCMDRSCKCMAFALADLFLLRDADVIVGSYWSSFSEVAGALAGLPVELIGKDP